MKVTLVLLLALAPLALCSPVVDKRFLDLGLPSLGELRGAVQQILNKVGYYADQQQCKATCDQNLGMDDTGIFISSCKLICKSFHYFVNLFGLHPQGTTPAMGTTYTASP